MDRAGDHPRGAGAIEHITIKDQKIIAAADLSASGCDAVRLNTDANGTFKAFPRQRNARPLAVNSASLANPPLTANIYKSNFYANGYTGGIWYIIGSGRFTISTKGNGWAINTQIESDYTPENGFSYQKNTSSGKSYYAFFSVDPATYTPLW